MTETIFGYVADLREILGCKLNQEDVEEAVCEVKAHLVERSEELRLSGMTPADSDTQAIKEFGDVREIADGLAANYAPKPPFNGNAVRRLPEFGVGFILLMGGVMFSLYGGARGLESACLGVVPTTPMLVIPGFFGAMGKLKHRRMKVVVAVPRMAAYGAAIALVSCLCLAALQLTGHGTLTSMYVFEYASGTTTLVLYSLMQAINGSSGFRDLLRSQFRGH
jgi:hypothetical protein